MRLHFYHVPKESLGFVRQVICAIPNLPFLPR
jgi:hypothetical protein